MAYTPYNTAAHWKVLAGDDAVIEVKMAIDRLGILQGGPYTPYYTDEEWKIILGNDANMQEKIECDTLAETT